MAETTGRGAASGAATQARRPRPVPQSGTTLLDARLRAGRGSKARPAVYAGDAPWKGPEGDTNLRAVFRDGLFRCFLLGVLVMGALRGVLVVIAQPGEFLVKGLDGGFLLAENLFDQVMPVGFERLLLGKEFFNVVFRGFTRSPGLRRGSRRLSSLLPRSDPVALG